MPRRIPLAVLLLGACASAASAQEVTGLTLIDARTDRPIRSLAEGDKIDLAQVGADLNVRADTEGKVESVRFELDGKERTTESVAPFALFGDREGDYRSWTPTSGKHRLTATPFPERSARGRPGTALTVSFTVVGKAPARRPGGPPRQPKSTYSDIAGDEELGRVPAPTGGSGAVSGELKQWHKVTVAFDGPEASENGKPNPFLHYRLNVAFTQGDLKFVVPGYYAGDGKGGAEGHKWRVHFAPPATGEWSYEASFRAGYLVNVSLDPNAGKATAFDGAKGTLTVAASDKTGRDFRSPDRGLLANRGHHYLTFAGSGKPWVKGGPDIPENFLGYDGFDNTPKPRHRYAAHERDWQPGDPDWGGGRGKRIIGALNYIAGCGANCIYFLPMNIGGDGKDTFPTIGEYEKTRYDNSKLEQWEIVFAHAQAKGIFLHFQLAETERDNEGYHDGGELGPQRKLFYRELIARFGHHPGLELDLGEENDYGTERRKAFAAYLKAVDPYDHPLTTHTHSNKYDATYGPLLGDKNFDITAFQGGTSGKAMGDLIAEWRKRSARSGVKLAISFDEPQKIENDQKDEKNGYAHGRRDKMWPVYASGGAGFEWYVQADGGGHGLDHRLDDFREMEPALRWAGHAVALLQTLPLLEMAPDHTLGSADRGNTFVLAKPGSAYLLYNDQTGRGLRLDLRGAGGRFEVEWFDPRRGGPLRDGSVKSVDGDAVRELGSPPSEADSDWVCLVRRN